MSLQSYICSDGRRLAECQKRLIRPPLLLDEPAQVKPGSLGSTWPRLRGAAALRRAWVPRGCVHAGVDAEPHPPLGNRRTKPESRLQRKLCSDSVIKKQSKGKKRAWNDESHQSKFVINSSLLNRQVQNNPKLTSRDVVCFKVSEHRLMKTCGLI